jgi:uroporphyrinogen decarboxylase
MTSRNLIRQCLLHADVPRCGFWLGNPHPDTLPIYFNYFGVTSLAELQLKLGDDLCWVHPTWNSYRHPQGKPIFDKKRRSNALAAAGVFADCESVQEVEDFEWPNPDYLDFSETIHTLQNLGDVYRASGFWSCFFHDVADFFGMDNYFIKMYTHPEVVHAVTQKVVDFYLQGNERYYAQVGDLMDAFFFGNDFGTQQGLLISPQLFDEFVFPYFKKFTDQAHEHGYKVILHSCGSIYAVIPSIIALGAEALHPLQAKAKDMAAEKLAAAFKDRIAFIGGVDTQQLLIHATPQQVKSEVQRLKDIFGPNWIISPSHEALLPNIPPQNVAAMAEAAHN